MMKFVQVTSRPTPSVTPRQRIRAHQIHDEWLNALITYGSYQINNRLLVGVPPECYKSIDSSVFGIFYYDII